MKIKSNMAFTLIEFLIAFAIFSTIALSVYGTFYSGMQINKKAKNFELFYRNIYWSFDLIQRDLENMVAFNDADKSLKAFSGNADGFSLVIPTNSGLKKVSYRLSEPNKIQVHKTQLGYHTSKNVPITTGHIQNEDQINYLVRQEQSWGQISPEDEILNKQVLNNSLKISYASADKETVLWHEEWTDDGFPVGVRLEMTFIDPDNPKHSVVIRKIIPISLRTNNTNPVLNQNPLFDLNNLLNQNTNPLGNLLKINQ